MNNDQVVGELNNFNIDFIVPLLGGNLMLIILVLKYNYIFKLILNLLYFNSGKVHGSLARAGKVKGQTPKVEKVEKKKKKKTGRAKRRIQYNRRFVNVVQTFGRRRGPNANS